MHEAIHRTMMQEKGVAPDDYPKLLAIQEVSGLDFPSVLNFFIKYGAALYQMLVDLGFIKPAPPAPVK